MSKISSQMMKAIKTLKRRIRQLPWWWHNTARSFFIRRADLCCPLRTGIEPQFREWADWCVFLEVFVEGDYDVVIQETIAAAKPNATLTVLDLGANVGFFTLRFFHFRRRERPDVKCQIHQFEANASTFAELKTRMRRLILKPGHEEINTHFGAVGKRSGSIRISADPCHAMTAGHVTGVLGEDVQFIDLEKILGNSSPIHLLKCDIEGGESMLIESYESMLKRAQRLVVEFHPFCSDQAKCLRLLEQYGFQRRKVITSNQHISLEYFINRELATHCSIATPGIEPSA